MDFRHYQTRKLLYESEQTLIYRAYDPLEKRSVILKILKEVYPSPQQVSHFKQTFQTISTLSAPGIIKAWQLYDERPWMMVLEDIGGDSLQNMSEGRPLGLLNVLRLGIQIADGLGEIHQQGLVHKAINPTNLIWNELDDTLQIIDFDQANLFGVDDLIVNKQPAVDTLAYLSPEQTGRLHRSLDYRADFYALGVTLYYLLTGRLPFLTNDTLALIHAHLAKMPPPPHQHQPLIPPIVSDIVLKLMAKNPADRYQSAYGLESDLQVCLERLLTRSYIEPFTLAQKDTSGTFQLPRKLYGRDQEVERLATIFEAICNEEAILVEKPTSLVLVTGYAGVGKSSLVQYVHKLVQQSQGYFISGKFDQFQRDIPYAPLINAFQTLVQQLLTLSQTHIAQWRQKLLTALQPNGQIIVEVIPEIQLIIGPQPALPHLELMEAKNRFHFVFQNFVKVFAQPEHPLVMFLDDLQWADRASLNLLEQLITVNNQNILLVGAYRDEHVDKIHPLQLMLDSLQQNEQPLYFISLTPLTLANVIELVADTLNSLPGEVNALAQLIYTKTNGNPFFVHQFFKALYTEKLIKFSFRFGRWQWDLNQIRLRQMTDNVVTLMADKVEQLPSETQTLLKWGACLGNQFNLDTLALVTEQLMPQTVTNLWPGITQGLIVPLSDNGWVFNQGELLFPFVDSQMMDNGEQSLMANQLPTKYKFVHDRIQQAAYSLVSQTERPHWHWHIGQQLLSHIPMQERETHVFEIVNQFNLGGELVKDSQHRSLLTKLNLLAGQKAKSAAAYDAAFNYLLMGLNILIVEDNEVALAKSWQEAYDLTLILYTEMIEVAFVKGNHAQVEQLSEVALHYAVNTLDVVKIYDIKMQSYFVKGDLTSALAVGLNILDLFGLTLISDQEENEMTAKLKSLRALWAAQKIETLIDLPLITSPDKQAMMRILMTLSTITSVGYPHLVQSVTLTMIDLSLRFGHTPQAPASYITYGVHLCIEEDDIEATYKFGRLAVNLVEYLRVKSFETKTHYMYNVFIRHWKEALKETLKPLAQVYQSGLETGDLIYGSAGAANYIINGFLSGQPLPWLQEEADKYFQAIKSLNQTFFLSWLELLQAIILSWRSPAQTPWLLGVSEEEDEARLYRYQQTKNVSALSLFYLFKAVLYFSYEQYPQAVDMIEKAMANLEVMLSTIVRVSILFAQALVQLAIFNQVGSDRQTEILDEVADIHQKMRLWASHAPENYLNKVYLIEAEHYRVQQNWGQAREAYDLAIDVARANGFLQEEALACELAARFYRQRHQPKIALFYLQEAIQAYERWGATAKIKFLYQQYPQLNRQPSIETNPSTGTIASENITDTFDLMSIMKASQAISSEIVLDNLLTTLIKIVVENAGAQRGVFILAQPDEQTHQQWTVKSEWVIDHPQTKKEVIDPESPINVHTLAQILPITLINYVYRTLETIVLNDVRHQNQFALDPYLQNEKPQSVLCIPLLNQGELTGIFYLENKLIRSTFTTDHVQLLKLLSAQAAVSVKNASLYTNLAINEEKYRTIFENSKDAIYIVTKGGNFIDINQAGLDLFGFSQTEMMALNTNDLYVDVKQRDKFVATIEHAKFVKDFEVKLRRKDGQIIDCLLTATIRQTEGGGQIYQGIIRNITARKQAEREKLLLSGMQRELSIAQGIQENLLPAVRPTWEGIDMVCYTRPAREVGGDFYTYTHHPQANQTPAGETTATNYVVVAGDVSGKGMPAALLMAVSLASLQAVINDGLTPPQLLARLNTVLNTYTKGGQQNCAMVYLEFTPPQQTHPGKITVANAGCIAPLIRREVGTVEWVDVGGLPLGLNTTEAILYKTETLNVYPGDMIVLTSDGVVEANTTTQELFGFNRLTEAVASGPTTSTSAMLKHLQDTIATFTGDAESHDDLTIIVIKV